MNQALDIVANRFVRWDSSPRQPIEPLLAEVMAVVSEREADAGPQRLTIAEAVDAIRDLAEELGDLVWDDRHGASLNDLRRQAIDCIVANIRFVRDVCGER